MYLSPLQLPVQLGLSCILQSADLIESDEPCCPLCSSSIRGSTLREYNSYRDNVSIDFQRDRHCRLALTYPLLENGALQDSVVWQEEQNQDREEERLS